MGRGGADTPGRESKSSLRTHSKERLPLQEWGPLTCCFARAMGVADAPAHGVVTLEVLQMMMRSLHPLQLSDPPDPSPGRGPTQVGAAQAQSAISQQWRDGDHNLHHQKRLQSWGRGAILIVGQRGAGCAPCNLTRPLQAAHFGRA